jgi:hypothetical protein
VSKDPRVKTATFEEEEEPPPIDLNLYSVYRVAGSNIQKIIFGPSPEYNSLDPKSREYKRVKKAAKF